MSNKLRKMAPITILALSMMTAASNASAAFVGNSFTGFDSDNRVRASYLLEIEDSGDNVEIVANDFLGGSNSGCNSSDFSWGSSEIETGDADMFGEFSNNFNLNEFEWDGPVDAIEDGSVFNENTGAESDNEAEGTWHEDFEILEANSADAFNHILADANTGHNSTDFSFGSREIETGDIDGEIEGENEANQNYIELASEGFGDAEVFNEGTGSESDNDASLELENELEITSRNNADFDNTFYLFANTGYNSALFGGGGCDCGFDDECGCEGFGSSGELSTGDVDFDILLENIANRNETEVEWGWDSDIAVGNSGTGFDSDNDATLELENEIEIENENDADIDNNLYIVANTGENHSDGSFDSSGDMMTGDVDAEVAIQNAVNVNKTEVEGGWGGDIEVGNECTGAFSDNDARAEIENELEIENENDADIDNNIQIQANTGYNSSDFGGGSFCDTCGGSGVIETGDAASEVVIVNNVNSNETVVGNVGGGDISAVNSGTGAFSDNNATVVSNNSVNISNENNANITNNVSVNSNTGGNSTSFSNGASGISTGNASFSFGASNSGNSNVTEIGN